jgi:hypothetical protein
MTTTANSSTTVTVSSPVIYTEPAGVVPEPKAKVHGRVDWAVLFGFKAPASPDEALFGTTIRDAIHVIVNR